jgi:hypothetical protein
MWVTLFVNVYAHPETPPLWCYVLKNQQFLTLTQRLVSHSCFASFQLRVRLGLHVYISNP